MIDNGRWIKCKQVMLFGIWLSLTRRGELLPVGHYKLARFK